MLVVVVMVVVVMVAVAVMVLLLLMVVFAVKQSYDIAHSRQCKRLCPGAGFDLVIYTNTEKRTTVSIKLLSLLSRSAPWVTQGRRSVS